jgi:hypothetical protein
MDLPLSRWRADLAGRVFAGTAVGGATAAASLGSAADLGLSDPRRHQPRVIGVAAVDLVIAAGVPGFCRRNRYECPLAGSDIDPGIPI